VAKILITWELGGGSGHLVPVRPVIAGLIKRGHRVVAALRDVPRAGAVLADCPVRLLQAPFKFGHSQNEIIPPLTFAQILHNVGFGDELELVSLSQAWRGLFELTAPDLMICDHSPTALLASRGLPMRRIVMGSGFLCPPDETPLPNLRYWLKADLEQLAHDEAAVLERMNKVLWRLGQTSIERLTQIYRDVEATLLTTFEELDHFPWRKGATYWGAWTIASGKRPEWPRAKGGRIYAYLKDCPALPRILEWLANSGHSTLAYVDGMDWKTLERFSGSSIRFERERLDMQLVGKECDLAILHGTHGTTASVLVAGRPVMQLPIFLEQGLLAHAVCRLGAGAQAPANNEEAALGQLQKVISSTAYAAAAQKFATKYAGYEPAEASQKLLDEIERVLRV